MKLLLAVVALAVSGCAAVSRTETAPPAPSKGAYYKDDGPGDNPPANLASIPDAVPRSG